jgi:hypothetical protein
MLRLKFALASDMKSCDIYASATPSSYNPRGLVNR